MWGVPSGLAPYVPCGQGPRRCVASLPPRPRRGCGGWAFASTLDPIVPVHRAIPANWQATRVTVDAAGHCGMLLDREVIARIVAGTTLRADAEDLGARVAA